jgi:hypothetical protein
MTFIRKVVSLCHCIKIKGKLHVSLEFWQFLQIFFSTFKTFHLGVSKFGFLSLYPFRIENLNEMLILPLTSKLKLHRFGNSVVLE